MPITDRSLAPGTLLVARHKGEEHWAQVVAGPEGKARYRLADGREFTSPSAAGKAVTGTACNGWRFWGVAEVPDPAATPEETPLSGPTAVDTASVDEHRPTTATRAATRHPRAESGPNRQVRGQGEGSGQQATGPRREALAQPQVRARAGAVRSLLSLPCRTAHDGGIVTGITRRVTSKGNRR